MRKLLAASALIVAGCTTVPKEAAMDWPTFIASVPGESISKVEYKTTALKRSVYRDPSEGLWQTKASFGAWCRSHSGSVSAQPSQDVIAQSFEGAASDWSYQESVRYYETHLFCTNEKSQQLIAVMLIRSAKSDEKRLPILAFYTPAQATEFADYYNRKKKERILAAEKESEKRYEREVEKNRRLHAHPKIGDEITVGIIIDLRPPLALVQYNALQRQMFGMPQAEWVPINSLRAPRY